MMIIFKKKGNKFDQKSYDNFFYNIENNLRELGFGDVSVNKKMKELNKLLYDILLKIEKENSSTFKINEKLILKYFSDFDSCNTPKYLDFERYFLDFYKFCFELSHENMIRDAIKFEFKNGST